MEQFLDAQAITVVLHKTSFLPRYKVILVYTARDFAVLEKGQGHFVMDGTFKVRLKESIPFDEMPTLYNPESQYASSANQHA